MGIRHRSQYGFGRTERLLAADQHLDQIIAKLETNEPLRFRPAPASWQGKARRGVYRSRRLTQSMRRRMITLRLRQLASQHAQDAVGLNLTRAFCASTGLISPAQIMALSRISRRSFASAYQMGSTERRGSGHKLRSSSAPPTPSGAR